jgi:hypothetical protein
MLSFGFRVHNVGVLPSESWTSLGFRVQCSVFTVGKLHELALDVELCDIRVGAHVYVLAVWRVGQRHKQFLVHLGLVDAGKFRV